MANDRPRFFDDIAGVAGGAFSAFTGLYDEAEAMMRARVDEALRRLDLVRREDLEAVQEMAANARAGQEAAEARLAALEARIAALETPTAGTAASENIARNAASENIARPAASESPAPPAASGSPAAPLA